MLLFKNLVSRENRVNLELVLSPVFSYPNHLRDDWYKEPADRYSPVPRIISPRVLWGGHGGGYRERGRRERKGNSGRGLEGVKAGRWRKGNLLKSNFADSNAPAACTWRLTVWPHFIIGGEYFFHCQLFIPKFVEQRGSGGGQNKW